MNSFSRFERANADLIENEVGVHIVSTNFEQNTCIVSNQDKDCFVLPIEILVSDVMNEMVAVDNFSALKDWKGFSNSLSISRMREGFYPDDYFNNTDKYIAKLDSSLFNLDKHEFKDVYLTVGKLVADKYSDGAKDFDSFDFDER